MNGNCLANAIQIIRAAFNMSTIDGEKEITKSSYNTVKRVVQTVNKYHSHDSGLHLGKIKVDEKMQEKNLSLGLNNVVSHEYYKLYLGTRKGLPMQCLLAVLDEGHAVVLICMDRNVFVLDTDSNFPEPYILPKQYEIKNLYKAIPGSIFKKRLNINADELAGQLLEKNIKLRSS